MSTLRKLAGHTMIYGVPSVVGRILNYFLVPLHLYIFRQPEDYGVVTEFYAYTSLLLVLLLYGMETAYFRFAQQQDENKVFHSLQAGLWVTSSVFLVGTWLAAPSIARGLGYGENPEFVRLFAFILFADVITALPLARFRYREQPMRFAGFNLASIGTNIALNLFFLGYWYREYQGGTTDLLLGEWFDPDFGVGYIFLANAVASGVRLTLLGKKLWISVSMVSRSLLRSALGYAWPLVFVGLSGIVNETADRAIMKHVLTPRWGEQAARFQLGVYGACYKLSIIINLALQAFRYAAEPLFFRQIKQRSDAVLIRVMNVFTAFLLFVFMVISLFLDWFKWFISTEAYWEGLDIVPVLLLANCFLGMHIQSSIWYKISDQNRIGARVAIIAAVLTLIGNFSLVPVMGYRGAAYTTLAVYIFLPVCSYILSRKHYFIRYQYGKLLMYLLTSTGCVIIGRYLAPDLSLFWKALMVIGYGLMFLALEKKYPVQYGQDKNHQPQP